MEHVAGRFPDVRQNDVVLSKPLPMKQEVDVIQLEKKHQTLFSHSYDVSDNWLFCRVQVKILSN